MAKKFKKVVTQSSYNGISRVILNDPNTYNSLSYNTIKSLIESFKKFNKDNNTKVIIIEGRGNGFCAGHNLKELQALKKKKKNIKNYLIYVRN
tara:strand:+ start:1436 stop:1714 length:279 start_codon:yes stop_codon:yes gene_type:complete